MKTGFAVVCAASLIAALAPAGAAFAADEAMSAVDEWSEMDQPLPSDRIIVRWHADADRTDRAQARRSVETADAQNLGSRRFQLLELGDGEDPDAAVAALKQNPAVANVSRDGYSVLDANEPNDPLFNQLWGLDNKGLNLLGLPSTAGLDIDALGAWGKTTGDMSVVVADLDDGIRPQHPDLASRIWNNSDEVPGNGIDDDGNSYVDDTFGMDFAGSNVDVPATDNDPTDDIQAGGHGTHTAGTIAAAGNNGQGITGVAQKATLMPLRVCGWSNYYANVSCPFSSQVAAINYAGKNGARIANMSLGGTTGNSLVRDAFAANPQVLFVISAGNDGWNVEVPGQTKYPCAWDPTTSGIAGAVDNVVCVAASDQKDGKASFSNWGKVKVDLAAPGTEVLSTYPHQQRYAEDFESSFAFTGWTNGGFTTGTGPFTTTGITNNTSTQTNNTTRSTTTPAINVTGPLRCVAYQTRKVTLGTGDSYNYAVYQDGSPFTVSTPAAGDMVRGSYGFNVSAGSHAITVRYDFTKGTTNTGSVWLDNLKIGCWVPPGAESSASYEYLQGTSMAAPQVTGAAALLAAYEPDASTMQLKQALLTSVDPVAIFHPNTGTYPIATGGRLNANKALDAVDALVAPDTTLLTGPSGTVASNSATMTFSSPSKSPVTYECQTDGAGFAACASPHAVNGLASGAHTFAVRAKDAFGNVDPSPATASWTVQESVVAPAKVTGLKVKRLKKKAKVSWQPVAGADAYQVRWAKGKKKFGKWVEVSSTKKTIKKLSPKKKYKVQVIAVNNAGTSPAATAKVKKFKKK